MFLTRLHCHQKLEIKVKTVNITYIYPLRAFLVVQTVKILPAMQEAWVQSLGQKDPLQKEKATHSSILAWEIHRQRSLMGCSPWDHKESDTTEQLTPIEGNFLGQNITLQVKMHITFTYKELNNYKN